MKLNKIKLENYRNIEKAELEFNEKLNILYGKNGSGKTNLAEAVYYFAIAKSFRVQKESKIVRTGEYAANAEIGYFLDSQKPDSFGNIHEQRSHITVQNMGIKYLEHNEIQHTPSEFVGKFRAVLYTPDTPQTIIKGAPLEKRRFMDIALCQADHTYMQSLSHYNKIAKERVNVMKQRIDWSWRNFGNPNRLPAGIPEIENFDFLIRMYTEMMSTPGGYVMFMRKKFASLLTKHMNDFLDYVYDGRIRTNVIYKPCVTDQCRLDAPIVTYRNFINSSLKSSYAEDMEEAQNSYGVHKDNLIFEFNGVEAKDAASQGQMRIIGIALKFAEGLASQAIGEEMPVYILDDVMSELDRRTQMRITDIFSSYQTIVTTADSGFVDEIASRSVSNPDNYPFPGIFGVADGKITEI